MLQDLLAQQKALFPAQAHTELRMQQNSLRRVDLVSGSLLRNTRTDLSGVSARVYQGGVYGFASAADCSPEAAKTVVEAAQQNAAFLSAHAGTGKGPLPPVSQGSYGEDTNWNDVPQKDYIDFLKALDDYIVRTYPDLKSRKLTATADTVEKVLSVSDGWDCHTVLPRSYIYVRMGAETAAGVPVEVSEIFGGYGTFDRQFTDVASMAERLEACHRRLMDKKEGVYPEAGVHTVVLGGELAGMLAHEAVGHTVEADLVLGGSVAGPNLGKVVGSPLVSLTDFASTAFGAPTPLPVYVDDEGTKAENAKLIENGVLTGFMHSRASAQQLGMAPTGNARAWLFSDEPLIRMRNTAIHPGTSTLEELIASVDDGYYLVDTNNGQADATGEFMFGVCMGYEIKGGKLGRAILDTTISGIAFDMLKTVDMVSDTVTWNSSGFCGKKQIIPVGLGGPALRCRIKMGGR
ncbi:MAG: TldD/PmbA family protein [Clostridiales bacterium]|nr:TldD/PmbA family protein [Clostridiales bacterium]